MAVSEGFVSTLKSDGTAEVVIQPIQAGVPGASARINRRVCHCVAEGSTVIIEAVNSAGAEIGDYVSVRRDTYGLVKNAAALLGIPLMGLILGIVVGDLLTDGFAVHIALGMAVIAICVMSGIAIGVLVFRRISPGTTPVVETIIEKNWKGGLPVGGKPFCTVESTRDCASCGL